MRIRKFIHLDFQHTDCMYQVIVIPSTERYVRTVIDQFKHLKELSNHKC